MKFKYPKNVQYREDMDADERNLPIDAPCETCGTYGHSTGMCATGFKIIKLSAEGYMDKVELYSSLDKWQKPNLMTFNRYEGLYKLYMNFPVGRHEFKFKVNGNSWTVSDYFPKFVNKEGLVNNYVIVKPFKSKEYVIIKQTGEINLDTVEVKILLTEISLRYMLKQLKKAMHGDITIEVYGSWNNWANGDTMTMHQKREKEYTYWYIQKPLSVRFFEYKFKIDGEWGLDVYRDIIVNGDGHTNHALDLPRLIFHDHLEPNNFRLNMDKTVKISLIKSDDLDFFALYGHSMNAIGPKIYIYGGFCRNSFINSILELNPDDLDVKVIEMVDKNSPNKISFHRTVKYGEKIIMYGGQNENRISNRYHTYNTITRVWTSNPLKNKMPERELFSIVHRNGTFRLYIFGGYYCSGDLEVEYNLNDLYILHLDTLIFEKVEASNPPEARCHHTANLIGSMMYVFGGCKISYLSKEGFNDLYKIDLDAEDNFEWQLVKPQSKTPEPRYGHLALHLGKYVLVNGGRNMINNKDVYYWDLWVYDTLKNLWSEIDLEGDKVKLARAFHGGCIWEHNLFIFGGKFDKLNTTFR